MKRALVAISGVALTFSAGVAVASSGSVQDRAPRALAPVAGGMWEVTELGREGTPRRICVSDVSALAQFEHLGNQCTRVTVNETQRTALIRYTCTAGGFGTSDVEVVTPRSLKINTQGIKRGQPFNRTLLARRTGSC